MASSHIATVLLWGPILFVAALSLLSIISLIRNIRIARRIGLPYVVGPISSTNLLWILVLPLFRSWICQHGPDGLRLSCLTWMIDYRHSMHQKYGAAFVHVTPGNVKVYVATPAATKRILAGKGITKDVSMYRAFDLFGPNIFTTEGEEWARHKKIAAPPLNERNSELVWKVSLESTGLLLKNYDFNDLPILISHDVMQLSLDVFSIAGFGVEDSRAVPPGYTHTFEWCLRLVVGMLILIALFPRRFLYKHVRAGIVDLEGYMRTILEKEKKALSEGKQGKDKGTLLAALIRESEKVHNDKTLHQHERMRPFSEAEIFGNMFILYFAGHDTTAHTMMNAIHLLSVYPDVQNWVREEVRRVVETDGWNYSATFPKLVRCLALMHETLRIYGVLDWTPRQTSSDVTLDFTDVTSLDPRLPPQVHIPPGVHTLPCVGQLHTHPFYWGADSLVWNPRRWVKSNEKERSAPEVLESPAPKDTFYPWAGGIHTCLGKKFSQVEFVAVLAQILHNHRIDVVPLDGEDSDATKKRVLTNLERMVLGPIKQMQFPNTIAFRFTKMP